jgi:hypothetical protein
MNASRTVSRGELDRRHSLAPVFEALREQVGDAERHGVSHAELANAVAATVEGMQRTEPASGPIDALTLRLAWVVAVHAPAYDPLLVATLPFCLESIVEGYATLDDLFEHVETAEPVAGAPSLPSDLPRRSIARLEREVRNAVEGLRNDPLVLERIIDRIWREEFNPEDRLGSQDRAAPELLQPSPHGSVVQRLPRAVRDAVASVLQVDPAPGAVPLMQEIAGRLDPRSVRRLAGELVHASSDGDGLRVRARAAASLLAMHYDGALERI